MLDFALFALIIYLQTKHFWWYITLKKFGIRPQFLFFVFFSSIIVSPAFLPKYQLSLKVLDPLDSSSFLLCCVGFVSSFLWNLDWHSLQSLFFLPSPIFPLPYVWDSLSILLFNFVCTCTTSHKKKRIRFHFRSPVPSFFFQYLEVTNTKQSYLICFVSCLRKLTWLSPASP